MTRFLTTGITRIARNVGFALLTLLILVSSTWAETPRTWLGWEELPSLPNSLGVAGPFVGVHNDALIVAAGANFPVAEGEDLWKVPKVWHADAWVLTPGKIVEGKQNYTWNDGRLKLDRPVAYGACVSTKDGIVCMGGNDGVNTFDDCFLLIWDPGAKKLTQTPLPKLPKPCAYGAVAMIGSTIYLSGGQTGSALETATNDFWALDMSKRKEKEAAKDFVWKKLPSWPGPTRAFHLAVAQHNGFSDCIYIISGRRQKEGTQDIDSVEFLTDVYEFSPARYDAKAFDPKSGKYSGTGLHREPWRKRSSIPTCVMAGTGTAVGQSHIFVLSGADGSLLAKSDELKDAHPGFPKKAWSYHTITDTWIDAGATPANQVTTPAVKWGKSIILASGEVRPRVRTSKLWRISPTSRKVDFGAVNFSVLGVYLLCMVGVGVYFANKNKNTDDYFRGGQRIPWWVAGCSIFATMLSSITFMAIPAKAFAQDWVYLIGNLMILTVAPIAVYMALPFYRRIDATSAYEYLHKRFNLPTRLFASASFTFFHIFRMGIVMSLAGLALATVTPLSAVQCVLIMGVLSMLYCTMGGVEAVVWTDTIQTFVLLGGALLCLLLMLAGCEGGLGAAFTTAIDADKFRVFNLHWDPSSASLALWVVILGGIGQQASSYTGDQAVVQRYMTTRDQRRAARAIWTNALLSMPASLLFFGVGTALFVFYRSHPEKLDPTFTTDQIFPLFIANEVPIGVAGLIVAGIFAAAQSTVSTSMNSTATALVTDFLRPFNVLSSERSYLNVARVMTFMLGLMGTLLGLLFVSPNIMSLFDEFIKVIGLFMGLLGGLFCLGVLTRRANGAGALTGAIGGAAVIIFIKFFTDINGYLYAVTGMTSCFVLGYLASLCMPAPRKSLDGLTLYTMRNSENEKG